MLTISNLKHDITLAPYTTYKIGGPADYFIEIKSSDELKNVAISALNEKINIFLLGLGANILISDQGFRGLVILNRAKNIVIDNDELTAESGATIEEIINLTKERGFSGFEHFAGIPSTIGGALKQNLHFLSPDRKSTVYISEIVKEAMVLDGEQEKILSNREMNFSYDDSIFHHKNLIILSAKFKLSTKPKKEIENIIFNNISWRNKRHPSWKKYPSCGSVFKKIEGVGAGRLIEQIGLKGKKVGGAKVSEKHANFIINNKNAKAEDVRKLIKLIQEQVKLKTGYFLEPEISFIGEFNN